MTPVIRTSGHEQPRARRTVQSGGTRSAPGGIIGMILAVPLTAFIITLWRHLTHRYMSHVMLDDQTADTVDRPSHPDT